MVVLLATWSQLMELLFTREDEHVRGIGALRRHILGIAETKHCYGPGYYANATGAAHGDVMRHLDMAIPIDTTRGDCERVNWSFVHSKEEETEKSD